jgi:hypothetical protein
MAQDMKFQCGCGKLAGVIEGAGPKAGHHVACYCTDCRAFVAHLGQGAKFLDEAGGTDLFQTSPARVKLTAGAAHLASLRLSPKGLYRWYAACCNTPLFNTGTGPGLPFASAMTANFVDGVAGLGPVKARVNTGTALGPVPQPNGRLVTLRAVLGLIGSLLAARIRGDQKRSPFFDAETGAPAAKARVLTLEERQAASVDSV